MRELSDIVERKFIDSVELDDWQVWTDDGWKDVTHLHTTVEYEAYVMELDDGTSLRCADTHIVFDADMRQRFVMELKPGDEVVTEFGLAKVEQVFSTGVWENMYDMTVASSDHRFYTNGILSHNTVTTSAYMLWCVLFNEKYNTMILANKRETAMEIIDKVKNMYEELPLWLQQGVVEWNKSSIELENGSRIMSNSTSPAAIRGYTINTLFLDEFAIVPNNVQEDFWNSVFPTISSGKTTKIIITSTPKGLNYFYKIWEESRIPDPKTGKTNGFKPIEIHWSQIPGRDEAWAADMIAKMGQRGFDQEFNTEFLGSSSTLISGKKLSMLTYSVPLKETGDGFKFYEPADRSRSYMMVVDTARGTGLDYSAFIVFDTTETPYRVVCTFRNNDVSPIIFPKYIMEAATYYNNCYILVESNDLGQQVVDILHYDMEYDGLISTANRTRRHEASSGFAQNTTLGVRTTKSVKRLGCATFKSLVEMDQLIINDFNLKHEMSVFTLKNGSYEASEGEHDDLVMCGVLFAWVSTQPYFKDLTGTNITGDIYRLGTEDLDEMMIPFGVIDDGRGSYQLNEDGVLWEEV